MAEVTDSRLSQQIGFILEIDRLKGVLRRTILLDRSRHENSAEHSWHLALMALVLAEYASEPIDPLRVLQMVLVHDIVEIDAGDTYCYDEAANEGKLEREEQAAERLFALLPEDQGGPMRSLWREFEAGESADARFAAALDRLQPLLHNYHTEGQAWRDHGVVRRQVIDRNGPISDGSERLWDYARDFIEDAVAKGYLAAE